MHHCITGRSSEGVKSCIQHAIAGMTATGDLELAPLLIEQDRSGGMCSGQGFSFF